MIEIKAEDMGKQTKLEISIHGSGKSIIQEALHIMEQLPKLLKETSKPLFYRFMAELMESDLYGEDEENEDDDD